MKPNDVLNKLSLRGFHNESEMTWLRTSFNRKAIATAPDSIDQWREDKTIKGDTQGNAQF